VIAPGAVVTAVDRIDPWPVAAFSAAARPARPRRRAGGGAAAAVALVLLPDHPRSSELGADGHPLTGPFLPSLPHRRRMVAGGRWRAHAPVRVGDAVARRSQAVSSHAQDGRSGAMLFVTVRHALLRDGELLAVEEQDVVYRSQPPGVARPLADGEPAPVPAPGWRWAPTPRCCSGSARSPTTPTASTTTCLRHRRRGLPGAGRARPAARAAGAGGAAAGGPAGRRAVLPALTAGVRRRDGGRRPGRRPRAADLVVVAPGEPAALTAVVG
jgi:3-methylfumaryl-CoA hydratase